MSYAECLTCIGHCFERCADILFVQLGRTALYLAAEKGHQASVALLLDHKADANVIDNVCFQAFSPVVKCISNC